jgi:hypothetical protein
MVLEGLPLIPAPQAEPREVSGVDLDVAGETEELRVQTVVELARALSRLTRQSGRPTAPMNSVSPVKTNQGSGPRRRSDTTRDMLSGV